MFRKLQCFCTKRSLRVWDTKKLKHAMICDHLFFHVFENLTDLSKIWLQKKMSVTKTKLNILYSSTDPRGTVAGCFSENKDYKTLFWYLPYFISKNSKKNEKISPLTCHHLFFHVFENLTDLSKIWVQKKLSVTKKKLNILCSSTDRERSIWRLLGDKNEVTTPYFGTCLISSQKNGEGGEKYEASFFFDE